MTRRTLRTVVSSTLAMAAMALAAPAAQAGFGVQESHFESGTCNQRTCTYSQIEQELAATGHSNEAFTQAAAHPPWGGTAFELNSSQGLLGKDPEGSLKRLRVDVPPGLAADPQALASCPLADFQRAACSAGTQAGTIEMTAYAEGIDLALEGTVYNLGAQSGLPLYFGIEVAPLAPLVSPVRLYLEGHDAWSSDYHEYFEIRNVPKEAEILGGLHVPLSVLRSKLNFNGRAGNGNFLTLPSVCSSSTTSRLEVESWSGEVQRTETHTPTGVQGCGAVPFSPSAEARPGTSAPDEPDGATISIHVPQHPGAGEINDADVRDLHVALPEGLTLDPSAAPGLQTCTAAQIGIGTANPVSCPAASRIGSATVETDLPAGSLTGPVYLASPAGGALTGPPYAFYIDAESSYAVSVRLRGLAEPNALTGRLEAAVEDGPQLPFSSVSLTLAGGPRATLANPLACQTEQTNARFTPYTGAADALSATPFAAAPCSAQQHFSPSQVTSDSSSRAGAFTSFTFSLQRRTGEQYLSGLRTELPAGLLAAIPSVPLCGEPAARNGTCAAGSRIGTATVKAGAGPDPVEFSGTVSLTGPYGGSPFGLSIPILAKAGPFDLGTIVTQVQIGVDEHSGRVIATAHLPTIVGGVPIRLRELTVALTRANFLFNPTSCGGLSTDSTLTSTLGGTSGASTSYPSSGCRSLAFKPSFALGTDIQPIKANGSALRVRLTQGAHQANIHSVRVQLPPQLLVRQSSLKVACPAATFAAGPGDCPPLSIVGSASVSTPVLAGGLKGPVYLVSHGGAAFPDLDVVLSGSGVRVDLVGTTVIQSALTTTTFAAIPDVPISSFSLDLAAGPYSVLSSYGNLCAAPIEMPTTITAQNGAVVKRSTRITVHGCAVQIARHRTSGHRASLLVKVAVAGRLSASGRYLQSIHRRVRASGETTLVVRLSRGGLAVLRAKGHLTVRVRVLFTPARRGLHRSTATATLHFG